MVNPALIRITFDSIDDVWRELRILESDTLLALHHAVLKSFGIEEGEMASFYVSDEHWNQLEPIVLVDLDEPGASRMDQLEVGDVLGMPGDRLLYVYDFLRLRTFYVERLQDHTNQAELGLCGSLGELPPPAEIDAEAGLFDDSETDLSRGYDEYGLDEGDVDEDETDDFDPFDERDPRMDRPDDY